MSKIIDKNIKNSLQKHCQNRIIITDMINSSKTRQTIPQGKMQGRTIKANRKPCQCIKQSPIVDCGVSCEEIRITNNEDIIGQANKTAKTMIL